VAPAAPYLLDQDLTRRRPVVAFAVPYETPYGRRVFSGAYEIASTPLADYLGNAVPIASTTLYLVDPGGVAVASNRQLPEGLAGLGTLDPALAASLARRPAGGYRSGAEERNYASRAVEGTPARPSGCS
jgi:hypothetical protein